MLIETFSFTLSPLNFHDRDISMDSLNAVLLTRDEKSGKWDVDEYGVLAKHCAPPPLAPLEYGTDRLFDLQGRPVKSAPNEWLRENAFPYIGQSLSRDGRQGRDVEAAFV